MFESLRKLFGGEEAAPHPAMSWEPVTAPLPVVDIGGGAVGALKFGDPVEGARFLGRPDAATVNGQCVRLDYRSRGFEIEFEGNRFVELEAYIGPGAAPEETAFCTPQLSNGGRLTTAMTTAAIKGTLGEPTHEDPDEDEAVLSYDLGRLAHEFHFGSGGALSSWVFMLND